MVQDRAIVTMADQYKVVHGLSNRAILKDLELPKPIFQGQASLMPNICEMAKKNTAIVTMEGE